MKNRFIYLFRSKIKLSIRGKHIERFIHNLARNNIDLLSIKEINKNNYQIIIYESDYLKLDSLKSIYEVDVLDSYGLIKIRKNIKVNRIIIICFIFGLSLLIYLTNTIFKVEVIHTSSEVRNFLINELKSYGINKYSRKKNFKEIEKIKNQILDKYPNKIEWLEIETVGVKYVVRVELREIMNNSENNLKKNVVAKKDCLIKKVIAKSGMIVKNTNNYVKKGDIVISGSISLNDSVKGYTNAEGTIYGEVWYKLNVEYPYNYYEEKLTGNSKKVLSLKFLNHSYDLFSPYKNKKSSENIILKDNLLPIKLVIEKQNEMILIDQILTEEEAIEKGIILAKSKMKNELEENEYIIDSKLLKVNLKEDKVVLEMFFLVYEDVTDYSEVVELET